MTLAKDRNQISILMLGKPGGTLARTYEWHIEALKDDALKRFAVDDLHNMQSREVDISGYDIFWFYAKAFHPSLYYQVKNSRPDAKIICGPNILLDKPDVGPADEWDRWYVKECKPDLHLDQVKFYSEHVKKFLNEETRKVSKTLDKCIKIDNILYKEDEIKLYDCLLYSKKRRYDYNFEKFRNNLVELLEKNKISYSEVRAGKFGKYEREEYFNLLNKSKIMINLSLDECPGILNYESMFFNVPVVGSPNNVPVTSDKRLHVLESDRMTDKYLVRGDNAAKLYFEKIKEVLSNNIFQEVSHRDFILEHTSFKQYANRVDDLLGEL
tara:strand:+ start:308 stop:1285 length:978 start_codon:yes stop_codon:yes gene_type:complete